jgi:FkbM family methyltransferase
MIRSLLLPLTRAMLRSLQTEKRRVGVVERTLRSAALVPAFGLLMVALRSRARLRGPLEVDGTTTDGVHLRCRLPDLIQTYIHLFRVWEPDISTFIRQRLARGDIFVDIGANVGVFAATASRLVGPEGRVIAIEPSPAVLAELRHTISMNNAANVRVIDRAVSDRHIDLALYAGPAHNIGLTSTVPHRGMARCGTVPAAPLGDFIDDADLARARLIKIDVEGGEPAVLRGILASMDRLPHHVEFLIELSPLWWPDPSLRPIDILKPYLDRGFHVYTIENNYWPWRYLWPHDVDAPKRVRDLSSLALRVKRLDIVLSRADADAL